MNTENEEDEWLQSLFSNRANIKEDARLFAKKILYPLYAREEIHSFEELFNNKKLMYRMVKISKNSRKVARPLATLCWDMLSEMIREEQTAKLIERKQEKLAEIIESFENGSEELTEEQLKANLGRLSRMSFSSEQLEKVKPFLTEIVLAPGEEMEGKKELAKKALERLEREREMLKRSDIS